MSVTPTSNTGSGEHARRESTESEVSITSAGDAACCGAAGCTTTDELLQIVVEGTQRVLCERHARAWISEVVA